MIRKIVSHTTEYTRKEKWDNHKSNEAGDRPMQERREWNTKLDMQNLEPFGYTATRRWNTESSNLNIAIQSAASPSTACARPTANHSARFAFKLYPALRQISALVDSVLQRRVTVYHIRDICRFCTSKSSNVVHQSGVE